MPRTRAELRVENIAKLWSHSGRHPNTNSCENKPDGIHALLQTNQTCSTEADLEFVGEDPDRPLLSEHRLQCCADVGVGIGSEEVAVTNLAHFRRDEVREYALRSNTKI